MPQIRIRGVKKEDIKIISKEMVDNLERIIGCPRDYFTIEVLNSTFIQDGEETDGYPFVEVAWFDRGQEIQDKVAEEITMRVKGVTGANVVDVAFSTFHKNCYYENGEHF